MRRLVFTLLALTACKGELHDLGDDPAPLATLRGTISGDLEGTLLDGAASLGRLRVGLLWAGVPVFVPYCHENGPNPRDPGRNPSGIAEAGCRDPFDVVASRAGPSVAVDPRTLSFELPLAQLPSAEVMVGPLGQRVVYGTVVLFDDRDEDGELDLRRGCGGFGRGGGGGGPDAGSGSDQRELGDPVYAASFHTLKEEQLRVAYVEGPFDPSSFFYPHPGCSALPPGGFSLWRVGALLDPSASCRVDPIDTPLELAVEPPVSFGPLLCEQRDRESFSRPPSDRFLEDRDSFEELLTRFRWECWGDQIAMVDLECACPEIRVFGVKGCWDEVQEECPVPDWDLTETLAEKGIEWPCQARP